jgi:hypothetical protein
MLLRCYVVSKEVIYYERIERLVGRKVIKNICEWIGCEGGE